ncbi:Remorin C-terminal protein [Dioscorea alata]|nr:Remorin C-terminal protein [Dioscorea alata]
MNAGDASDSEFATTVAAAAYAITTLEEERSMDRQNSVEGLQEPSLSKMKSKKEETVIKPTNEPSLLARWLSGKDIKDGSKPVGESSMKISETKLPSMKKTPTFSDNYLNEPGPNVGDSGKNKKPGTSASMNVKPVSKVSSELGTKASEWQKAELDKIQKRYQKMTATILEWENEKKIKAKRKLDQKESTLEARRARALQEYRNEMSRIDQIAGGARGVAEEKRRNDELKTIEKAKSIQTTGRTPHSFLCF